MDTIEVKPAIELVEMHLRLWAEPDPAKRLALSKQIYSEDIRVTDPGAILNGYSEVSNFIGDLLSNNPGFDFSMAGPVEVHHYMAILRWHFGPAAQPDKISGQDIFTLKNGRITSFIIFVDGVTAAVNGL